MPRNAYVEDAPDADTGAVAVVNAPPRAPTPPPAARSLGYQEPAALPPVNVFDFLEASETPSAPRVDFAPVEESRMIEDSIPPAYEEVEKPSITDVMQFQVPDGDDGQYNDTGFAYGSEAVRPSNERFDSSYNIREQEPVYNYETPAPKSKHSRTKSRDKDRDLETTTKTDRKRKRNSPTQIDMELVRAQQERDMRLAEVPPMLHSGLTGGLNRLLGRPEFPPSPDYSGDYMENSPLSPMKRAKQVPSKALARAQREWEIQQEKERKAVAKEEIAREKEERKERGRERERKERKVSSALVKIKPKLKKRDDSGRASRRTSDRQRARQYSSSPSPAPEQRKALKAIEYHRSGSQSPSPVGDRNNALIVRQNGELAPVKTAVEARAELFMSFITKGPESERGMSVNKALKRYHRERYDRADRDHGKADEEKELWKNLRLKRNDRGEIVLFFSPEQA